MRLFCCFFVFFCFVLFFFLGFLFVCLLFVFFGGEGAGIITFLCVCLYLFFYLYALIDTFDCSDQWGIEIESNTYHILFFSIVDYLFCMFVFIFFYACLLNMLSVH